jgi:hypothetical protein
MVGAVVAGRGGRLHIRQIRGAAGTSVSFDGGCSFRDVGGARRSFSLAQAQWENPGDVFAPHSGPALLKIVAG